MKVRVPGKEYRPFSLWPQATVTAAWTMPIQQVPIFSLPDLSKLFLSEYPLGARQAGRQAGARHQTTACRPFASPWAQSQGGLPSSCPSLGNRVPGHNRGCLVKAIPLALDHVPLLVWMFEPSYILCGREHWIKPHLPPRGKTALSLKSPSSISGPIKSEGADV